MNKVNIFLFLLLLLLLSTLILNAFNLWKNQPQGLIEVSDQSAGDKVRINRVVLPQTGWIVIERLGSSFIPSSEALQAGTYENIEISLVGEGEEAGSSLEIRPGDVLFATIWLDVGGNALPRGLDFQEDKPLTGIFGRVIQDSFRIQ